VLVLGVFEALLARGGHMHLKVFHLVDHPRGVDLGPAVLRGVLQREVDCRRGVGRIPGIEAGLARELARMNLPMNIYTQWYWKVDLHNLFHFLRLRADAHAQFEIRTYAEVICDIVKSWVPLAYRAFEDYRLNAVTMSSMEIEALREYFKACQPDREDDGWPEPKGLSDREAGEFFRKIGLMK